MKKKFIPYGKHYIDKDDIAAVVSVLKNGWLTQGPKISELEKKVANKVGSKYAVAVSSASAALHLACIVSGLKKNDYLYTSANTFVASSNCGLYLKAVPKFIDIDQKSLNMCAKDLESKLIKDGNKVKVVIPVHFAGVPSDMKKIRRISNRNKAIVIEDASHALGGNYQCGSSIGSCKYSNMTIFSLHPVKGVTAGEGGIITTNNYKYHKALKELRSHGIYKGNFDFPGLSVGDKRILDIKEAFENKKLKPWYYEMQNLGYNYRITDIQCALAISQMNKLNKFISRRKKIAKIYDRELKHLKLIKPTQIKYRDNSAHHLYVVRIDFHSLNISRAKLMNELFKKNIGTQVHYIPVPMHPYYKKLGYKILDYPNTKSYYEEGLSLPMYFGLEDEMIYEICTILKQYEKQS